MKTFHRKQALEHEVKDLYLEATYAVGTAPEGTLETTTPITIKSSTVRDDRNEDTITLSVAEAAANPTDTVLINVTGNEDAVAIEVVPNDGTNNPTTAATATLDVTADITLTDNPNTGVLRNTTTFTTQVEAAAANPTDTVLVAFTGTAAAIVCTVTPNDGTNNSATPVNLTTAELVELINSGVVVGKNVTVTDSSNLRELQTATGGDATPLADSGEGDGVVGTFANGANTAVDLTTAELVEAITTGAVVGKTVTITDTGSLLDDLATSTGGGSEALAHEGEGDGEVATLAGGVDPSFTFVGNQLRWGIKSLEEVSTGDFKIVLSDNYVSFKNFEGIIKSTSTQNFTFQIKSEDVNNVTTPTVSFYTLTSGVKTNPANGSIFKLKIEVKNTTII